MQSENTQKGFAEANVSPSPTNFTVEQISMSKLHAFRGHPFKVVDGKELDALTDSIRSEGIHEPLIVRPLEGATGEFEVISGHRRLRAAQRVGLDTVPTIIHYIDHNAAAIEVVDGNLHRHHLLPSEQAAAIKLKFDALQHQGRASAQNAPRLTVEEIGEGLGISRDKVKRLKKLNDLNETLLEMIDAGKIGLISGCDLAQLSSEQQEQLAAYIAEHDRYPSGVQAQELKKLAKSNKLDLDTIAGILSKDQTTSILAQDADARVKAAALAFSSRFPAGMSAQEIYDRIDNLLAQHHDAIFDIPKTDDTASSNTDADQASQTEDANFE